MTDFHCHSKVSVDGEDTMAAMARAEYEAGVRCLCFTEHCDTVDWQTLAFDPNCLTVPARALAALEECRAELPADMDVRVGIELGETTFHPELAEPLYRAEGLDFVLGSLHITPEYGDYFNLRFETPERCRHFLSHYLETLTDIARAGFFDVMAHIGYLRRYMLEQGLDEGLCLAQNGEAINTLFRILLEKGKGIELNSSGIRDGSGPFPSADILKRWRALGGEIVTVGSDAHNVRDAGACLAEAYELLRSLGYRYVAVYKNHKPEFLRL